MLIMTVTLEALTLYMPSLRARLLLPILHAETLWQLFRQLTVMIMHIALQITAVPELVMLVVPTLIVPAEYVQQMQMLTISLAQQLVIAAPVRQMLTPIPILMTPNIVPLVTTQPEPVLNV